MDEMSLEQFGLHLLVKRKTLRLTQAELAKRAGVSRNYISMIERAVARNISKRILEKLAYGLDIDIRSFLNWPQLNEKLGDTSK